MFDNIQPIDPRRERRKKQVWIGVAVLLVVVPALWWQFKNWPEERVAARFLEALQRGDYPGAYAIWQPAKSYVYDDFLRDWGPQGEHGRVNSFAITTSHERGSGVIVTAEINGKATLIWVEKKDKSLSFPP
jgi:4-amino-4-deoxy-L-arabinose transferase-like glycosyltransferase